MFEDVGNFHRKFRLARFPEWDGPAATHPERIAPHLLDPEVLAFRTKFLVEELTEFSDAHDAGDLPKAADALIDLVYVALGTLHMMHCPADEIWREVQRANMAKVRSTGDSDPRSTRKSKLDVVKPPGWTPPDVEGILREYGWEG